MIKSQVEIFSDGTWVIMGDHVSLETAKGLMIKEDPGLTVTDVWHYWVRHEFMTDEDIIDQDIEYYGEGKRPKQWFLYESRKRPRGITKKATVLWVD